jgi:hypothetical protein
MSTEMFANADIKEVLEAAVEVTGQGFTVIEGKVKSIILNCHISRAE